MKTTSLGYMATRTARRTTCNVWALKLAKFTVQSSLERMRISWNSAEASRQFLTLSAKNIIIHEHLLLFTVNNTKPLANHE